MIYIYIVVAVFISLLLVAILKALIIKKSIPVIDNYKRLENSKENELFKDLSKLLVCKTIDGAENCEKEFEKYECELKTLFPNCFKTCENIDVQGAFLYRFVGEKNSEKPTLILAHCDVVEENGKWEHSAFSPTLEDGKIFARGTIDNKGMAFSFFSAMEKFITSGGKLKNDLYFLSTKNEESTSFGAKSVAKYFEQENLDFSVIFDEGGAVTTEAMPGIANDIALIGLCEKGYFDIEFSAKSKGGHSGSPLSSNPIHRLSKFVCEVEKKGYFKVSMPKTVCQMLSSIAPYMTFPLRLLLGNMWLFKPVVKGVLPAFSPSIGAMMKTTIVFTRAEGSGANNVIPETAKMVANIRNLPTESKEEIFAKLSKTAQKHDIEMNILYDKSASSLTDAGHKEFVLLKETIQKTMPSTLVCPYVTIGATDCCYLDKFSDAIVRFSPIRATAEQLSAMHGIDENIGVAELEKAIEFFYNYIKQR